MSSFTTFALQTYSANNTVQVSSTANMVSGVPITFAGSAFGNIAPGANYYVGNITAVNNITLTTLPGGATWPVANGTGNMTATFTGAGQEIINTGTAPDNGTGSPLRTAFTDTNVNFDQIFAAGPVGSNIRIVNNTISTVNTNGNLVLNPNGIGNVVANAHVIPDTTNIRNLGSQAKRFATVYAQYLDVNQFTNLNISTANLHITGGSNGYVLQTDGTGNLTWTAQTGGTGNGVPAGANTQVQFNDAGAFGGQAGFTFDKTSNVLAVNNVSAGTVYSSNFYGNAIVYANATGYLTNTNLFKYNPDTQTLTVGAVSTAGNITGANVISASTFSIAGSSTELGQIEGANTVGFYTSDNTLQYLFEGPNNVTWGFNVGTGGTGFPTLNVQRGDNPSGTIQGQTLLFGDATKEAIITTPNGVAGNEYSQRLVINPGAGYDYGEGGDIYLWAGRGGDNNGSGGDVKIRGGQGMADGTGGYIRMDGGDSQGNGQPGFIEITGGQGGTTTGGYVQITGGVGGNGTGGVVDIYGGYGISGPGAAVNIAGGGSSNGLAEYGNVNIAAGASTWSFKNNGTTQFPNDILLAPEGSPITVETTNGNALSRFQAGSDYAQIGLEDNSTGAYQAWAYLETDMGNVNTPSAVVILKPGNTGDEVRWTYDALGNLTLPSNIASINYANGSPYGGDTYGNSDVSTFLADFGSNTISTSGNITANEFVLATAGANTVSVIRQNQNPPLGGEPFGIEMLTVSDTAGIYSSVSAGPDYVTLNSSNGGNANVVLQGGYGVTVSTTDPVGNNEHAWTFGVDGTTFFPDGTNFGDINGANTIGFAANPGSTFTIGTDGGTWAFGTDGNLTLPAGGIVSDITADGIGLTVANPPTVIVISGADFTAVNITYDIDPGQATPTWVPANYTPGADPYILFDGTWGIWVPGFVAPLYVNTGSITAPLTQWNTNPPLGSVAPTGAYLFNNPTWTFNEAGNLTLPVGGNLIVSSGTITGDGASPAPSINGFGSINAIHFKGNGSQLTGVATQVTGSWTLSAGTNTVSLSVPLNGTYSIWVNGNIPNGIVTYTATVVVTNTNVPVVGSSYGWYYAAGNALVLTAIPTQIVGSVNNISNAVVATTTANVFTFGITNNSGNSQVVNYGYTQL